MNTITQTKFKLKGQVGFYSGKVRDVYYLENNKIVILASDRISAFDVVLPKAIPYKGIILNRIAAFHLKETAHLVPNWLIDTPHPRVSYGHACQPFQIEIVVRAYLAGHAWREYSSGKREICGVQLPDGLKEGDALEHPIITPTTKASSGLHDEDISYAEILEKQLATVEQLDQIYSYALSLFSFGQDYASSRNLILVDTKYEFGIGPHGIMLMDEIHTPDSSRYYMKDGYEERQRKGISQIQLSKEFVREWLMLNGFQGKQDQKVPEMTNEVIKMIQEKYVALAETLIPEFQIDTQTESEEQIEKLINSIL
jgi:phosphoribosylaminoimidazole-succinocarboxamide synthase